MHRKIKNVNATSNPPRRPGRWLLQDAKARFSELVRRARSEGPQHVTVHGRDQVVVVAAEEFRRLKGGRPGDALITALRRRLIATLTSRRDANALPYVMSSCD